VLVVAAQPIKHEQDALEQRRDVVVDADVHAHAANHVSPRDGVHVARKAEIALLVGVFLLRPG